MKYIIIEKSNFADIEKVQNDAKNRIKEAYKLDRLNSSCYTHGTFAVIGEAVKMFCDKYGVSFAGQNTIKTDGKTKAEIIPFITPSFYYDARSDEGGLIDIYAHDNIKCLVNYNGVLLEPFKLHYNKEMFSFRLFNDNTDYNTYLPYNWEKENVSPNNVGTITDKKIESWVNWLKKRQLAALNAKDCANNKVNNFLAKIREFDVNEFSDYKITDKSGYFVKNGLRYSYQINKGGYISENIEIACISTNLNALDKFKLMTQGKF